MERSKVLMTPMTVVSSELSGSGVTATSDPSPGISNSIITCIIGTATSKGRHPVRSLSKSSSSRSYYLPSSNYPRSRIFPTEPSPSFDLSEVTKSWTSSENISGCRGILFTPMLVLKSLLVCIKSKSTRGRNWLSVCPTSFLPRLSLNRKLGYPCLDIS
jgi:hypothetical protein